MKAIYKILIAGVVVLFALTSCLRPGTFNPYLGGTADTVGDATTEQTLIDASNDAESSSEAEDSSPLSISSATPFGTFENAVDQIIDVFFTNGIADVDAATGQIAGLMFYPLSAAASATEVWVRGTALAYTAVVNPNGASGSRARVTIDLDGLTTNRVEIFADPTLVTANGGTKMLNEDADDVMGEAEDAHVEYETVADVGATLTLLTAGVDGVDRSERLAVDNDFAAPLTPALADGDDEVLIQNFDVNGSDGYEASFSATSIGNGISFLEFSPSDQSFAAVSESARTYYPDATVVPYVAGDFAITASTAFSAGEIYQFRYNRYNIATSTEVYGFIQRDYYSQNDSANNLTRTNLIVIDDGVADTPEYSTVAGVSDSTGEKSITITFSDPSTAGGATAGDVVASSLTTDSVIFFHNEDNNGLRRVDWVSYIFTTGTDGANQIEFYLPSGIDTSSSDGTDYYRVMILPSVMTDAESVDSADYIPVLDTTNTENGAFVFNGTW